MSFAHLHTHTSYSLLDGEGTVEKILDRAKELGQTSMAITDHGNMYGVIEFYEYAKKIGIHPVIGCEVYVAARTRFDRVHEYDVQSSHLILLAENEAGLKNLMYLVSCGFTEGFYYKPRVDFDLLKKHSEGLIALSGCMFGVISRKLLAENRTGARETLEKFLEIFGRDNFFIELQDHGIYEQKKLNMELVSIAREYGVGVAATNDIHYVKKSDAEYQDILMCIQMGKTVDDPDRMKMSTEELYVKSEEEMLSLFSYIPEAIENTELIARRCNVEFEFGKLRLPKFDLPENYTSKEYLYKLCDEGYTRRYSDGSVRARLEYELGVIENMGYIDYFLIVWDFVNFAKKNNIMVGPGRGSAAGSVVSYCLGITDIDPIKYDLIFERFLNPERVTMPDIDIDFCYERRGEVIDYVNRKYGTDRVAQIVTFGTMAARLAVRDTARALDIPYSLADKVAKQIPHEPNMTIKSALEANKELRLMYESDARVKKLIDTASELEGLPRHTSTHAAGVVITNEPVVNYVPLQMNDDVITTQFTMTTIERLGLLKMDFLGLRTLTVIRDAIKNIEAFKNVSIDINAEGMDDKAVYKMISDGATDGVFQLESGGMKEFMKELCPESIEDIIAGISLYRPGPMDSIPKYISSKRDASKISYKHPMLERILNVTYGCIVYQEQVMQIVRELGGYSLGRADMVRRAMSKKKSDVMKQEKHNFIYGIENEDGTLEVEGAVRRGIDEKTAGEIFDEMMDFAKYAFNKSHAAAYAYVSYQTAWLKCHYPAEFFAALLTSVTDRTSQITKYINTVRRMGLKILPPDINESFSGFVPEREGIRFGLGAIKNVGSAFVEAAAEERSKNGKFTSYTDFCRRLARSKLNKRIAEALIKCGAFDCFGHTRATLLKVYETVLDNVVREEKNNLQGQYDIFSLFGEEELNAKEEEHFDEEKELDRFELLKLEKEYSGIYISGHPLDAVSDLVARHSKYSISDITELAENAENSENIENIENKKAFKNGAFVTVCGMISGVKKKLTKRNEFMLYVELEDLTGSAEVIVFPSQAQRYGQLLYEGSVCVLTGHLDIGDEASVKIIFDSAGKLDDTSNDDNILKEENTKKHIDKAEKSEKKLYVRVADMNAESLADFKRKYASTCGVVPVVVFCESNRRSLLSPKNLWVYENDEVLEDLKNIFGNENVKIL